jgi:hypothetical protein
LAEIGHENLRKPHVAEAIEKARAKRAERTELTADWVVDPPPPVGRRRIALVAPTAADAALIGHENLHCWCHAVDDVSLRSWSRVVSRKWAKTVEKSVFVPPQDLIELPELGL